MNANQRKKSGTERFSDQVDFDDPLVVANWTRSLRVDRAVLDAAVEAVGSSFGRVYDYVMRNRNAPLEGPR